MDETSIHSPFTIYPSPPLLPAGGGEAERLAADGVGDVAVLAEPLKLLGVESREDADRGRERRARVAREVVDDRVLARPAAVHRDQAQHLVGDGAHGGDGLDLLVG